MIRRCLVLLIGGMSAFLALGCGGGDDPQQPGPDPNALNFGRIAREVINTDTCGGLSCHSGTAAGFKLTTTSQLYPLLVGAKATGPGCEMSGLDRIVPGDPDNSLLFLKISATPPPCGKAMPEDNPLDAAKIDLVRSWIEAGAPKD